MKSSLPLLLQRLKDSHRLFQEAMTLGDTREALEKQLYHEARVKAIISELNQWSRGIITEVKAESNDGRTFMLYYYNMNSDEIKLMIDLVDKPRLNISTYIIGPQVPTREPISTQK